ncbi:hypothetical protein MTR_3g115380 [Medicago truncatula]|uniref:Uncharacterized protein n=1 Tax=Medicago truncatula TaxID=3880 RepID=A0A072V2R6_MEDTR|nr:hypothetical protein MTR_3g115380 [Medicago truncatula]
MASTRTCLYRTNGMGWIREVCLYGAIKFIGLFQNIAVKCIRGEQNALAHGLVGVAIFVGSRNWIGSVTSQI